MAGFTAINASSSSGAVAHFADGHCEGHRVLSHPQPVRTVASDYLGRDDDLSAAPPPNKNTTKGKKRAVTADDASKVKRRRSSNIDDGLPVTKSRKQDLKIDQPNNGNRPQKPSKPKKKERTTATKQPKQTSATVSTGSAADGGAANKPVSVYASATSMDALDSTSARTSVDSVKANAGQSFTLYQGPSSAASFHSNVEFSQPWLSSACNMSLTAEDKAHGQLMTPQTSDDFVMISEDDGSAMEQHASSQNKAIQVQANGSEKSSTANEKGLSNRGSSLQEREDGNRRSTRPKKAVNYAIENSFPSFDLTQDEKPNTLKQVVAKPRTRQSSSTIGDGDDDDDFGELPEDEAFQVAKEIEEAVEERRTSTPPPRGRKQNTREVDEHEDYGRALLSDAERKLLTKMKNASEGKIKPIIRKPFQHAILDRSPVFGASNNVVLRTSFRVGEALNFGAQAVRCSNNAIIELYARVTFSKREGRKQHFVFKDLYHDKPPYLEGTFGLFDQSRLWDLDSKPFLKARGPGILSRAITRMKRDGQKWRLEILNIWEASWEDVNHVAGIYTGECYEEDEYNI